MTRQAYNNSSIRIPRRSAAEKNDEYGADKKGIEECPVCKNVYYEKRWIQSISDVRKKNPKASVSTEAICPACKMIEQHLFEGEVTIEHIPEQFREDIMGLIKNFGNDSIQMDPQDRIISIEDKGDTIRITTTENQMAERLGKKIHNSKKNSSIEISHAADPYEVTRVHVVFNKEELDE